MVLGIGGPAERPEVVARTTGVVRHAGVVPADELLLAVPVLVRGGRVSSRRLAVPLVAIGLMLVGFLVGRDVGESDPTTGIVLVGASLVAGAVAVLWLLADGVREVRRFGRGLGGAATALVAADEPVVLALTHDAMWFLAGRGAALRVTGRVPIEDVDRFAVGLTATPAIDVTLLDGSHVALRAGIVDHAKWLWEATQPWRDLVAEGRARRRHDATRGGGSGADGSD